MSSFTPQPYPLEASSDGGATWSLVLGWQRTEDGRPVPVLDVDGLAFRQAGARQPSVAPRASSAASIREPAPVRSAQPEVDTERRVR